MTMAQGNNDLVWMATMRAVSKYDAKTEEMDFVFDMEPTLDRRNIIRALFEYEGWLLLGTTKGAFAYHLKEQRLLSLPFLDTHPKTSKTREENGLDDRLNVKQIHRNHSGNFLFSTTR